ncbi:MAG: hypothetical protein ACT4OV_08530 [Microthrixaceae bacterium]
MPVDVAVHEDSTERRWGAGRVIVTVLVVGMVSMWGYVLYLAFGPGRLPPPDRLADPSFAQAAQLRCRGTLDQVAQLPRAVEARTATERAEVVEQANDLFAQMLIDLEAIAPGGDDGALVREWLADWHTYLGDRQDYAAALRRDPEARLLVTPKQRAQITEYLDGFAADNHMPACATPLDVS